VIGVSGRRNFEGRRVVNLFTDGATAKPHTSLPMCLLVNDTQVALR
jgi:hypothetical protein